MQVRVVTLEVWPVFAVDTAAQIELVEVPDVLIRDWTTARKELGKAEQRIFDHLKATGQPVPEAFGYRL